MSKLFSALLRFAVWMMLSADLSWWNVIFGVVVAFALPTVSRQSGEIKETFVAIWAIVKVLPLAYWEAIAMMLSSHDDEGYEEQAVPHRATSDLIFLDIFMITLTPKTIVARHDKNGKVVIHYLRRRRPN